MKVLIGILVTSTLSAALFTTPAEAQPVFNNRCAQDSLDPAMAEARLAWARRCALVYHVGNPASWFDTGVASSNGAGTLKDYAEDDPNVNWSGHNRYISQAHSYEANYSIILLLYLSSPTNTQLTDANGYYRWERPVDRKKPRPLYPTFGTLQDIYSPYNVALFPNPYNSNDCNLYPADQLGYFGITPKWLPIEPEPCVAESASCYEPPTPTPSSTFYINAYCESSCYAPEQRVLFPEGLAAIVDAHSQGKPRVMTLTPGSSLHDINLQPTPTHSYTAEFRDSTHPIVELTMASGGRLRVTTDHPMINGEGRLVAAQTLKVGDDLIRKDGAFDPIAKISRTEHFGKVYNLRPDTNDRVSNILVAEGYLVGSSLFQNDEVGYMNRIILHKSIPEALIP